MVWGDTQMPNILIVLEYDIWAGTIGNKFLEIMSPLEMAKIEGLNLLEYVGGMAMTDIRPLNVDQQKTAKAVQYHHFLIVIHEFPF